MTEPAFPALSVVIVAVGDAAVLGPALDAVTNERGHVPLEIIVPCTPAIGRALDSLGAERRSGVLRPSADPAADTWALRAIGVAAARAPIVATIENHTIPEPGWAAAVIAAHQAPHAAVGGTVNKGTPDSMVGWAMYFFDYWRYLAPEAGPSRFLSACNVSYKREALARIATLWSKRMHETDVHAALADQGGTLWLEPRMAVRQRRPLVFREAWQELFRHGRLYGADRAGALSGAARLVRAVALPALPVLQLVRVGRRFMRAPGLIPHFLLAAPLITALALSWSAGELRGLISGAPRD